MKNGVSTSNSKSTKNQSPTDYQVRKVLPTLGSLALDIRAYSTELYVPRGLNARSPLEGTVALLG